MSRLKDKLGPRTVFGGHYMHLMRSEWGPKLKLEACIDEGEGGRHELAFKTAFSISDRKTLAFIAAIAMRGVAYMEFVSRWNYSLLFRWGSVSI